MAPPGDPQTSPEIRLGAWRREPWFVRGAWAVVVLAALAGMASLALVGHSPLTHKMVHAIQATALGLLVLRAILVPERRLLTWLITAGLGCFALARIVDHHELVGGVLVLVGIGMLWASILLLLKGSEARIGRVVLLDGIGFGFAAASLVTLGTFESRMAAEHSSAVSFTLGFGVPVLAAFALASGIALEAILQGGDEAWLGAMLLAVAGVVVSSGALPTHLLPSDLGPTAVDGASILTALAAAAAVWLPPRAPSSEIHSWGLLVVPSATGAIGVAVLAGGGFLETLPGSATAFAALAIMAVLVRMPLQHHDARFLGAGLRAAQARLMEDQLTGLLGHRAFQERLADEIDRAIRDHESLALVVLDIDHFAAVNGRYGHEVGDRVIQGVADCLRREAAGDGILGRIGGESFGWLLPACDDLEAWDRAEAVRHAIKERPVADVQSVTVSAGVTDLRQGRTPTRLLELANGALYWAKDHGRDNVVQYNPGVVQALSAEEKSTQMVRGQALNAMRVLARAVDARDPYTRQHSERVADLSVQLATVLQWPQERIIALREAALVHDVGKIGVPDSILLKPTPLDDQEREQVNEHAALGAQIVGDVLTEEQTAWVRGHHERFDGRGYPDGIAGADITDGARVMAVADSWDAMTTDRPYRKGLDEDEAMRRVVDGSGTQFDPEVVVAIQVLHEAGAMQMFMAKPPVPA